MKVTLAALALLPSLALAQDPGIRACINLGDALDSPSVEGEWSYVIDTADLDLIAATGFDTVRLPVRFSTRWDGAVIDPVFLARVDAVIRAALDRGLIVILDLHHFEDLMTDPDKRSDDFVAIWLALGAHYAGWPDGLYFELLNEPADQMTTARVIPLFAQIIKALRPAHPTRWIIVEGGDWAGGAELARLPDFGPYVLPSFHYYGPFEFTHQQLPYDPDPMPARRWDDPTERAAIEADFDALYRRDGPLFLGEFGTYRNIDPASRLNWMKAVRMAAEARGIGWCAWSLASNFGLLTEDKSGWLPGVTKVLGLPAPDP